MNQEQPPAGDPAFRDVDHTDGAALVAMMDDTDAWPEVQAIRGWALDVADVGPGSVVVDVGCGPGTFAAAARGLGATTVDVDRSEVMVRAGRTRGPASAGVQADIGALPVADGAADVVHCERTLQWAATPEAGLAELRRVVAGGWVLVTDTDWGTFAVDHPDPVIADAWTEAARRWIAHPTLARSLPRRLRDLGARHTEVRVDAVALTRWSPDDPGRQGGPPGLPLADIAAAAADAQRLGADLATLADLARAGRFLATVQLVSCAARW